MKISGNEESPITGKAPEGVQSIATTADRSLGKRIGACALAILLIPFSLLTLPVAYFRARTVSLWTYALRPIDQATAAIARRQGVTSSRDSGDKKDVVAGDGAPTEETSIGDAAKEALAAKGVGGANTGPASAESIPGTVDLTGVEDYFAIREDSLA